MGRHLHRKAQRKGANCAVSGGYTALNRITDVMRVTSPRITQRLCAIGPNGAGGALGNEIRRLRAGRGAPADSVSGWAGRLLSGLRLPALPVRPAVQSGAVPPRPATAQAAPGSTTRLPPVAPIAGRSPGRLSGPASQHPAPPTVSGSAAPLAGHWRRPAPARGQEGRRRLRAGYQTEDSASRIVQAASRP